MKFSQYTGEVKRAGFLDLKSLEFYLLNWKHFLRKELHFTNFYNFQGNWSLVRISRC